MNTLRSSVGSAVLWVATAVVFTMWVWGAETPGTSLSGDPRCRLGDLIHGTAHKPFVQRALIPMMTIGIHAMLPAEVWNGLESSLMEMPKFRKEMTRLQWEQSHLSEYIAALSLAFLFLVGFVFVVRRLWAILYRTSSLVENAVPLVALAFLPPFFMEGTHYIYDFPAMAFFALGLLLMLQSRWVL